MSRITDSPKVSALAEMRGILAVYPAGLLAGWLADCGVEEADRPLLVLGWVIDDRRDVLRTWHDPGVELPPSALTASARSVAYWTLSRVSAVPWVMKIGRPLSLATARAGLRLVRSSPLSRRATT